MSYVLKHPKLGMFRALVRAVRRTWKWERARSFPTQQAAADFKEDHLELSDFDIVPVKEQK